MRKIAIVGSGIVGLIAAHALRRHGFDVTLYSDRTAEQWLNESRPTGTAARFDMALSYERELGLNHWDNVAPRGEGVFLTFCPKLHNQLIRLIGRAPRPFQAVDPTGGW
jgi:2-polyprenyl-6-methoxyphenol hydroxylase-like FAD-dependent oxidoreductase